MIENRRIAKNTILLYFRMLLMMGISLYTSRVVLQVLGVSDYGLYNVVAGVISIFAFINGSLSSGTSRFITYELGIGDTEKLRDVFNVTLVSHILLAIIIFILGETIGLWFVNSYLNFPPGRDFAVNVVYQISIVILVLQLTQVPYNADIIAHEKMNIYAYISILEAALKLLMVLCLSLNKNFDNLILYSILLLLTQLIVLFLYRYYCYRNYIESKWRWCWKKSLYKEIFSFSSWDIIGSLCVISQGQGVNILLNIYFGPVVNAARAVSIQVEAACTQLTNNFLTAVNPQIVKNYARKEFSDIVELLKDSSRYGFFLMVIFLLPVILKIDYVLSLWLEEVPAYSGIFTSIIFANLLIRTIARPIVNCTHATGKIKRLNLYAGGLGLLPLPIIYVLFRLGLEAEVAYWIILLWGILANLAEIIILKLEMKEFTMLSYLKVVYGRCFAVSVCLLPVDYLLSIHTSDNFFSLVIYWTICVILNAVIVVFIGFERKKRLKLFYYVKNALDAKFKIK